MEFRGLLGKEFYDNEIRALIYSGGGYRYLIDDNGGKAIRDTQTGEWVLSYDREASYYYIPAGFELEFPDNKYGWDLTLKGEYDFLYTVRHLAMFPI